MSVRFCACACVGLLVFGSVGSAAGTDARLAEAAKREDRSAIRSLLDQKAEVNASLPDGSTALHWAVQADDLESVNLLLGAGANVKAANRYGVTPLHLATSNGNVTILQRLLKAGADPDARDASGETLLMMAVRTGRLDSVAALVERGASVNATDTATRTTPLMWAVRSNNLAAARLLIEHGAAIDATTRVGETPRWVPGNAGGGSHGLGIIRGGWPERGSRAAVPGGMTALQYAARDGRLDLVRTLLDSRAEINRAEANDITPLLMATTNDHMDVARLLVERGADLNKADFWGRTPLFAAVEIRNRDYARNSDEHGINRAAALEVITLLLDRGANPNARTREIPPIRRWVTSLGDLTWINMIGQTPFIRAAESGDITTMRLLLAKGADPKITTEGGTTALVVAAGGNVAVQQSFVESRESSMAAVKLCLELGIDINAANETGFTAVMGAANKGWDEILDVLLKAGGRLDMADAQGRTPLRWAKGEFIALHPPEEKPTTIALIEKYASARAASPATR